jgi:hypothetical protein
LSNLNLNELRGELDFSKYKSTSKICNIFLYNVDYNKINLRYSNMKLFFPDSLHLLFEDKLNIYSQLLFNFKQRGKIDSYENLDKELKQLTYANDGFFGKLLNLIDRHWWDYGYNKFLVVRNAVLFNLFFFIINIFIFRRLVHHGYRIDKFVTINIRINRTFRLSKMKRFIARIPYVFLYTCYIFWGWKLDINSISLHKKGLFAYVIFQYLVGIVCLAYIANLVITV